MEGEMVASNGVFKIDAAAQLKGEKSMMNPEGGKVSMGHNHGGSGDEKKMELGSGSEHEGHDQSGSVESMKMTVDENFKIELTQAYKTQLSLLEAFISSDQQKVKAEAKKAILALKAVNMNLLKGDMHQEWMKALKEFNDVLTSIIAKEEIEKQRLSFADYNDIWYKAVKTFGVSDISIYYQFCPMAKNGEGAYWLSNSEKIRNPYYGEAMLGCGEVKETIK